MSDVFGIHRSALLLHADRAGLVAENIANANTPGYKSKDIDFKQLLDGKTTSLSLNATESGHMALSRKVGQHFVNPMVGSLDGNTVDIESEKMKLVEVQGRYDTTLSFISGALKSKLQVIKGE